LPGFVRLFEQQVYFFVIADRLEAQRQRGARRERRISRDYFPHAMEFQHLQAFCIHGYRFLIQIIDLYPPSFAKEGYREIFISAEYPYTFIKHIVSRWGNMFENADNGYIFQNFNRFILYVYFLSNKNRYIFIYIVKSLYSKA